MGEEKGSDTPLQKVYRTPGRKARRGKEKKKKQPRGDGSASKLKKKSKNAKKEKGSVLTKGGRFSSELFHGWGEGGANARKNPPEDAGLSNDRRAGKGRGARRPWFKAISGGQTVAARICQTS